MSFKNEPLTDFSKGGARGEMLEALAGVRSKFGVDYPLVINGKRLSSRRSIRSLNPSAPREIVGIVANAERRQVELAIESARKAFEFWRRVAPAERAALLRRIAELLRDRKYDFNAWLVLEVGKNWSEADADVAEAIDFLEYYADLALIPPPALTPVPEEANHYEYVPLGPVVVIPPWNFPLAILVGMTSAAIVAGNTVILKPSSQSPVIAAQFMALAEEAGIPPGVLNLVSGSGGAIGDFLVSDPRVRMIAFTGSKSVGLHINALAAQPAKGQRWIKRVIAEMGGKNAIVVDDSADLEAAVGGVIASAFGYQGQKCSACSRVFVHAARYDAFLERLIKRVSILTVGPAENPEHFMGPVISRGAKEGIEKYVALGKKEGRLLSYRNVAGDGYFLPPTVFDRLPQASRLLREEIFGPVLAVVKVKDFAEALRRANETEYGLTGAVYSTDEAHLAAARREFHCGNLYLNRKCTGAWVGGHPFGGFDMSGTDSKAGGPEYLQLFRQGKVVSRLQNP